MKTLNRSTLRMFFIWLLVVPPGFIYILLNYFPQDINWLATVAFALFGFVTVAFPLRRDGRPVFSVMWVTVPVFLLYGLSIEVIVMQVSILGLLLSPTITVQRAYWFFLNSFWFFILSVLSAGVFFSVGGVIGSTQFWVVLLAVICYQLTSITMTRLLIRILSVFTHLNQDYSEEDLVVGYFKIIILVPFSLTLYFLFQYVGVGALFLLGIPYFFLIFIVTQNSMTDKVNADLQRAGRIGHEISGKLSVDKIIDQFILKVSEMFTAEYVYLFDHQDNQLELLRSYKDDDFVKFDAMLLSAGEGIVGSVLLKNQLVIYSKREEWLEISKGDISDDAQSVLCIPITRNQKIEGVLLLASTRKNAFQAYELSILDLLCSYFTVSIEKARYFQNIIVESTRCALTKLHNYRYFEERLTWAVERLNNGFLDELSVVMLDIDHFKKVNDTYGHQSGNDVLFLFAKKLLEKLPKGSVVARYGGEEFVYLLPSFSKEEALVFAEDLRLEIERTEFLITPDLGADKTTIPIKITASIGVSSAPEDTDDAQTILRNADRSLYLWAKQAGRNRVAGYVK